MKVDFIVEETKTGFSAYAKDYPVFTTGDSLGHLQIQAVEAINLYFEENGGIALASNNIHLKHKMNKTLKSV